MKQPLMLIFLCIVCFFVTSPLFSQDKPNTDDEKKTEIPVTGDRIPEEYGEDEFPVFLQDLRRAEIIAIGSFPFTFFISNLAAGFIRFYDHDFDQAYNPGFLMNSANTVPFNSEYQRNIILASIGLSLTMALADFIIGKIKHEKKSYRPAR